MGNGSATTAAARCPTPFAFPFTPFGLSLFDIDPSRILTMLHHQTWLAEEALRNRGLLNAPKDFTHRFNPLSDLLAKDFHPNHSYANTADLTASAASSSASLKQPPQATQPQQPTPPPPPQQQHNRSSTQHATIKQQQQPQPQYKQQQQIFNIRYPSPAAFFHHHHNHHHHQQPHTLQHQPSPQQQKSPQPASTPKATRQGSTPSPQATAISAQPSSVGVAAEQPLGELKRPKSNEVGASRDTDTDSGIDRAASHEGRDSNASSSAISLSTSVNSSLLYKDSLEQLLQRRRSCSSLGAASGIDGLRTYSQLLLSSTPSCTDTSSCKEKSSSSSTSSTPPPTSALLAQHQQLSQMLKSPSESSLFGETIEEETRCVVCNAHFPNVWLLEQHAALQHPHIGPGEEKPFICEQCGQSYRYRSAYVKHKEQNHRARLPADKLFTCDVCGMQFRYLKSFKKHRLNHALERLHGKKGGVGGAKHLASAHVLAEQDVVTSSQELMLADDGGEDLRINVKRERDEDERAEEEQDATVDSAGMMHYNDNNSTASASTSGAEPNISSSDGIHSTNKRPRLLNTPHMETDPSYQHLQRHHHHHAHHLHQQQQQHQQQHQSPPLPPHLAGSSLPPHAGSPAASTLGSLNSLNSITSLINAERIPSEQFLGLNPQEASILNFLRVDAAERQRDKRPQTSRFACPFCGKCVRSKENLKLHVRKHTGERPFVCLFCGRAFGGKSDLTRHLRIHTGERPYHCESCGKCFARADYLSKHLTTHIHNAPR